MPQEQDHPFAYTVAAWILTGVALVLVLFLHLLPALMAGLLVYELVHLMAPAIQRRFPTQRATLVAVALLSGIVMGLVSALAIGLVLFFSSDAGSVSVLMAKMADILETSRATMSRHHFVSAAPGRKPDGHHFDPRRVIFGRTLLEKEFLADAIGIAHENVGTIARPAQRAFGDSEVVVHDVELGVTRLRKKNLGGIGDDDIAVIDAHGLGGNR